MKEIPHVSIGDLCSCFFHIFNSEIDTDHSTQFLHSTFQVIVDRPQLSLKYLSFHTSSLLQAPEASSQWN